MALQTPSIEKPELEMKELKDKLFSEDQAIKPKPPIQKTPKISKLDVRSIAEAMSTNETLIRDSLQDMLKPIKTVKVKQPDQDFNVHTQEIPVSFMETFWEPLNKEIEEDSGTRVLKKNGHRVVVYDKEWGEMEETENIKRGPFGLVVEQLYKSFELLDVGGYTAVVTKKPENVLSVIERLRRSYKENKTGRSSFLRTLDAVEEAIKLGRYITPENAGNLIETLKEQEELARRYSDRIRMQKIHSYLRMMKLEETKKWGILSKYSLKKDKIVLPYIEGVDVTKEVMEKLEKDAQEALYFETNNERNKISSLMGELEKDLKKSDNKNDAKKVEVFRKEFDCLSGIRSDKIKNTAYAATVFGLPLALMGLGAADGFIKTVTGSDDANILYKVNRGLDPFGSAAFYKRAVEKGVPHSFAKDLQAQLNRNGISDGNIIKEIVDYIGELFNSQIKVVYGSTGSSAVAIPPALVKPVIDGKYTPLDQLQLTPLGEKWITQGKDPMPKNEWDDAVESKLIVISRNTDPARGSTNPEAYLRAKFYGDRFGILVDFVSDQSVRPNADRMSIFFDTQNVGKSDPGTPGAYYITLEYKTSSPDSLDITQSSVAQPGIPFPPGTVKYKSSLSPSPRLSENHKIIEAEFDLNLLTKYSKKIGFDISTFTGLSWLRYSIDRKENIYFSDETLPIPEFASPLFYSGSVLAAAYAISKLSKKRK
jgi:hypothetical protein